MMLAAPRYPTHSRRRRSPQSGRTWPWALAALLVLASAGAGGWWWQSSREAGGTGASANAAPGSAPTGASGSGGRSGQGGPGGPGGRGGPGRFSGGRVQPVAVATVERRSLSVALNAIGTITAANTAVVKAKIEGELRQLNFREGQWVQAGAVLAELDDRALRITLAQAEGQLARDKAQLQNSRLDLARFRELLGKDAIAKQQVDTQEAAVRQLEGTVQSDQAVADNARLQLSYTRITAPISGRVGLRQADLGNVLRPGDANGLVSIAQLKPANVVFAVPEANLPRLREQMNAGRRLQVEAWDRDGQRRLAVGQLGSLDNAIDAATSTIRLKATFPNSDEALYPNQFVKVVLRLASIDRALAVPAAAVLRGADGAFVYRVTEGKTVEQRRVQVGVSDGDWVGIQGDLAPGDTVVTDGVDRLREGSTVEVIQPGRAGGSGADAGGEGRGKRGPRPDGGASTVGTPAAPAVGGKTGSAQQPGPGSANKPSGSGDPARSGDAARGQNAGGPGGAAAADSAAGEQRRPGEGFLSRLPPEVAEKVRAMEPAERRAFFEKMRAERAKREAAGP